MERSITRKRKRSSYSKEPEAKRPKHLVSIERRQQMKRCFSWISGETIEFGEIKANSGYCLNTVRFDKFALERHCETVRHRKHQKAVENSVSIQSAFANDPTRSTTAWKKMIIEEALVANICPNALLKFMNSQTLPVLHQIHTTVTEHTFDKLIHQVKDQYLPKLFLGRSI